MGDDIAQWREWDHDSSVDWHLLQDERHAGIQRWVRDLNRAVLAEPALHRLDFDPEGFRWIGANDAESGVLSFLRCAPRCAPVMVVLNLTPVPRYDYRVGAPAGGFWRELLNSDASVYGGSGVGNMGGVHASDRPWNGMPCSIEVAAPPLAGIFLRYDG
jgi:1,4-alpha-glucan branching enzyme